jgi:signal transduction histidine kinase
MVIRDITERRVIAAQIQRAKDASEAANKAKSTFLAQMSHEIRTPLNAVIGLSSLLGDTPLTTEQREYVDTILTAGQNLLAIVNDITLTQIAWRLAAGPRDS